MNTKRCLLLLLICFQAHLVFSQSLASYYKTVSLKSLKGKELTINDCYYSKYEFFGEKPDTIWVKRVRNPKLYKHYRLSFPYKAIMDESDRNYGTTPPEAIAGRVFTVEDVSFSEELDELIDKRKVYTLKLKDIHTGEIIFMKLAKYEDYYVLNIVIRDHSICKDLNGKTYIDNKTGKSYTIKDCYYSYKSYGGSGWSLRYGDTANLEIEFEDGTIINPKTATNYVTIQQYNKLKKEKELKELKSKAQDGYYKMCISSVTKSVLNKTSECKIATNNITNITTLTDNNFSLTISPEEECFRFSIKNNSSYNFKIDWNNVVFVDEHNQSQRVIHSGIRYIDADKMQQPTIVAKGSSLNDILVPAHRLYRSSYDYSWSVLAILNYVNNYGYYAEGTQVKIILPIEINKINYEYTIVYDLLWEWKYPEIRKKWLENN